MATDLFAPHQKFTRQELENNQFIQLRTQLAVAGESWSNTYFLVLQKTFFTENEEQLELFISDRRSQREHMRDFGEVQKGNAREFICSLPKSSPKNTEKGGKNCHCESYN